VHPTAPSFRSSRAQVRTRQRFDERRTRLRERWCGQQRVRGGGDTRAWRLQRTHRRGSGRSFPTPNRLINHDYRMIRRTTIWPNRVAPPN
jgi:hypothetical protein